MCRVLRWNVAMGRTAVRIHQKEREAAQSNLGRVIQDYRKRFSAFSPTAAMAYKKEIDRVITTLLPAWLQFRNTFVPIKKAKEGNAS